MPSWMRQSGTCTFLTPLQNGDNFENLTLDHKVFVFGPYVKHEAIVIADVVRRDSGSHVFYNSNYLNFLSNNVKRKQHSISLNEAVVYYHNGIYHAKVLKLNRRKISIFYVNKRGAIKVKVYATIISLRQATLPKLKKNAALPLATKTILSSELAQSFGPGGSVQYMNEDCALIKTEKDFWRLIWFGLRRRVSSVKKRLVTALSPFEWFFKMATSTSSSLLM